MTCRYVTKYILNLILTRTKITCKLGTFLEIDKPMKKVNGEITRWTSKWTGRQRDRHCRNNKHSIPYLPLSPRPHSSPLLS